MNFEKINFRTLSFIYAVGIIAVSSIPGNYLPSQEVFSWDKVFHFVEYFIFTVLIASAYIYSPERRRRMQWIAYTLKVGIIFPLSDECYQSFIPGRTSSWLDVIADLSGVTIALFSLAYFYDSYQSRNRINDKTT